MTTWHIYTGSNWIGSVQASSEADAYMLARARYNFFTSLRRY